MEIPNAEQALQIIDELVNKTLNTQGAFKRAIEKLVEESLRIQGSVDDLSEPLSKHQVQEILHNVSRIIRELGMVEKGFGKSVAQAPHREMTYEVEDTLLEQ